MISQEIKDLNLFFSDKMLNKAIKENKNFHDENKKFSRTKYEKFLLSSNLTAPQFEQKLRENELRKSLFSYIGGGISAPLFFTNETFKAQTKKINLNYIKLNDIYKKKENFSNDEMLKFINENKNILKEKIINFRYVKITPKNLTGNSEFDNLFFEKIDEIENEITNGLSFQSLIQKYKLKLKIEKNYKFNEASKNEVFLKKIYDDTDVNKIKLIDNNDYYILYSIDNVKNEIPVINDINFESKIKQMLFNKEKFEFNSKILKKISEDKFLDSDFKKISKNNLSKIESIKINSIKDNEKFNTESIKYLYSLSTGNFGLIADNFENIYLINITKILENNILKNSKNFSMYKNQTNVKIRDSMYFSYDFFLNNKYKVNVNQKTLERVKNYFR